ncbi:hypothetical protein M0811_07829 [Anaeramoeba ignava]|uniref:VPS9 domain-containing protein n=1 Tax=Anaeramoeba ignava TaxID=1746090 RepID=A0A9Q0RBZ3_ANAIG|nr:hypothetical protein M0811_07829 [Anaeramoeba ignava]
MKKKSTKNQSTNQSKNEKKDQPNQKLDLLLENQPKINKNFQIGTYLTCTLKLSELKDYPKKLIYLDIKCIRIIFAEKTEFITKFQKTTLQFLENYISFLQKKPIRNFATKTHPIRMFIDKLRTKIIKKHPFLIKYFQFTEKIDHIDCQEVLNYLVERCLERVVITPIHNPLITSFHLESIKEDYILDEKMKKLYKKPPQFFGVANKFLKINWESPIEILSQFRICKFPFEFLDILINTADRIYFTSKRQLETLSQLNLEENISKDDFSITADGFLPIFLYTLVQTKLSNLQTIQNFLLDLSDPRELSSEIGYYLTTYCSSLKFIRSYK